MSRERATIEVEMTTSSALKTRRVSLYENDSALGEATDLARMSEVNTYRCATDDKKTTKVSVILA